LLYLIFSTLATIVVIGIKKILTASYKYCLDTRDAATDLDPFGFKFVIVRF